MFSLNRENFTGQESLSPFPLHLIVYLLYSIFLLICKHTVYKVGTANRMWQENAGQATSVAKHKQFYIHGRFTRTVMLIYFPLLNFSSSLVTARRAVHNASWGSSAQDPPLTKLRSTVTVLLQQKP